VKPRLSKVSEGHKIGGARQAPPRVCGGAQDVIWRSCCSRLVPAGIRRRRQP